MWLESRTNVIGPSPQPHLPNVTRGRWGRGGHRALDHPHAEPDDAARANPRPGRNHRRSFRILVVLDCPCVSMPLCPRLHLFVCASLSVCTRACEASCGMLIAWFSSAQLGHFSPLLSIVLLSVSLSLLLSGTPTPWHTLSIGALRRGGGRIVWPRVCSGVSFLVPNARRIARDV